MKFTKQNQVLESRIIEMKDEYELKLKYLFGANDINQKTIVTELSGRPYIKTTSTPHKL